MSADRSRSMCRVIYISRAFTHYDESTLIDFCNEFALNNAARGLTGVLVHIGGRFLQALEGESEVIMELMTNILRDPRHENVQILQKEKITTRKFSHWSMSLLDFESPEAHRQFGLSEFAGLGRLIENIDSGTDSGARVVRLVKTIPRLMKVYRLPRTRLLAASA